VQLSKLSLKKGSVVFKSVEGTNGFYYPSASEPLIVSEPCSANKHHGWISFGGLIPVVVPSDCFESHLRYDTKEKMIVWVSSKKFQNRKTSRR